MSSATEAIGGWSSVYAVVVTAWEWIELLFSGLWTGLEWPHAVLIMFCTGIWYFNAEIKGVIPRIKRIGTDGFEVEPQSVPVQPSVKAEDVRSPIIGDFPHTLGVSLGIVRKQFEGKSDSDAVEMLIHDDASWRVLWCFENIYSYIFGGQIKLLEMLNQRAVVGVPLSEVKREWDAHKELNKPQLDQLDMDGYIEFLIVKELIVRSDADLKITITGKEFLIWMTRFGRSADRLW
ncbi:hypothetical protein [Pseudomonas putida]|uniref:hypothetical protein n=1 Tax=Pseudomonas putida TaxID=303 RepID=UPI0009538811|nr:hypothetical protein [Pseudomonas putida]SIR97627.1 hypothetical protein SAMN05216501_3022 [Pseudomonas putida]